ncbi:MAG: transposase [Deltaproteobacteria bacterium]|nr:transposase [Deltaproteobacteria bacterium]
MSRALRIEYEGAWYHVMNRGSRRWNIFHEDEDRWYYFKLLSEIRGLWNVEVHGYSLMDNRYHLMVRTPNCGLSRAMRHLNGNYTIYYNRKYKKDGPLFRGRFKSIITEPNDEYLLSLIRYIHLNPVEAGLCRQPEHHPWTSHGAYLNKKQRPQWLVVDEILKDFSKTEKAAQKKFDEFVKSKKAPYLVKIEGLKSRVTIQGSEGFRDWIKYNYTDKIKKDRTLPTLRRPKKQRVDVKKIIGYIMNEYGVRMVDIERNTGRLYNEPRAMIVYLMREVNGETHNEIARTMHMEPQAVSKSLQRFKKLREDSELVNEKAKAYLGGLLSYVQS